MSTEYYRFRRELELDIDAKIVYFNISTINHFCLQPENILCCDKINHHVKIIDFGLAQRLDKNKPLRVLFGTPEFVPPEIVNYEPVGIESDMWSGECARK